MIKVTITGSVTKVGEIQTFQSGFTKRELIVNASAPNSKYPNLMPIGFTKERTAMLDGIRVGDEVTVDAYLDGRDVNGRVFLNLNAASIKTADGAASPAPSASAIPAPAEDDGGDIPF